MNVRVLEHPLDNLDFVSGKPLDVLAQLCHAVWSIVMFVLTFKGIRA
jgi:hypothetical protein